MLYTKPNRIKQFKMETIKLNNYSRNNNNITYVN